MVANIVKKITQISQLEALSHDTCFGKWIVGLLGLAGEEKLEAMPTYASRVQRISGFPNPPRKFLYSLKSICLMNTILPLSFLTTL